MQLLVIKQGNEYFRFTDQGHERCAMQKASVFPLEAESTVQELLGSLLREGVAGAAVYCLTITEEPYNRAGSR